jgi:hypothetical protein
MGLILCPWLTPKEIKDLEGRDLRGMQRGGLRAGDCGVSAYEPLSPVRLLRGRVDYNAKLLYDGIGCRIRSMTIPDSNAHCSCGD